jgi:hypothetical protein
MAREGGAMPLSDFAVTSAHQDLAEQIKKGECVLFLGASVHAPPPADSPYKYPPEERPPTLGEALAAKLADDCGFCKELPDEKDLDLQRVSLLFETTKGRKMLVDSLDRHLRVGKKPSPALKMLAGLPFKIIVTTNYDHLLESALAGNGKEPTIRVYNPGSDQPTLDVTQDPSPEHPLVFKMHGDLDYRDSIVITDEDYIKFVQRMADKPAVHPVPSTVRYRMERWPTFFIGYSLKDYNLRLLFLTLRWRVDAADYPKSFSLDREPDRLILRVWQNSRGFVTFLTEDLWALVPWLYKQIRGEEYPP